MQRRPHRAHPRVAGPLAALRPARGASPRPSPPTPAPSVPRPAPPPGEPGSRAGRPLLDRGADAGDAAARRAPRPAPTRRARQLRRTSPNRPSPPSPSTAASSSARATSAASARGRRSTAPPAQLVLTAGHCVNSGPAGAQRPQHLVEPARVRPRLQRRRRPVRRLRRPPRHGLRAEAVDQVRQPQLRHRRLPHRPNAEGVNVADAVGGGATIATDLSRHQTFQTFGYPGETALMQELRLALRRRRHPHLPVPGPPTIGDPLPLGARRQRRRLADRRRHRRSTA